MCPVSVCIGGPDVGPAETVKALYTTRAISTVKGMEGDEDRINEDGERRKNSEIENDIAEEKVRVYSNLFDEMGVWRP